MADTPTREHADRLQQGKNRVENKLKKITYKSGQKEKKKKLNFGCADIAEKSPKLHKIPHGITHN